MGINITHETQITLRATRTCDDGSVVTHDTLPMRITALADCTLDLQQQGFFYQDIYGFVMPAIGKKGKPKFISHKSLKIVIGIAGNFLIQSITLR